MTGLLSGHVLATRIFGGAPPRSRLQEHSRGSWSPPSASWSRSSRPMSLSMRRWMERWLRDHIIAPHPRRSTCSSVGSSGCTVSRRRLTSGRHRYRCPARRRRRSPRQPLYTNSARPGDQPADTLFVSRIRASSATARPWLAALLRWRHRGTFLAPWEDIARVAESLVTLRPGYTRYSAVLEGDD